MSNRTKNARSHLDKIYSTPKQYRVPKAERNDRK